MLAKSSLGSSSAPSTGHLAMSLCAWGQRVEDSHSAFKHTSRHAHTCCHGQAAAKQVLPPQLIPPGELPFLVARCERCRQLIRIHRAVTVSVGLQLRGGRYTGWIHHCRTLPARRASSGTAPRAAPGQQPLSWQQPGTRGPPSLPPAPTPCPPKRFSEGERHLLEEVGHLFVGQR